MNIMSNIIYNDIYYYIIYTNNSLIVDLIVGKRTRARS